MARKQGKSSEKPNAPAAAKARRARVSPRPPLPAAHVPAAEAAAVLSGDSSATRAEPGQSPAAPPVVRWPLRTLPVIRLAGQFPHDDHDFRYRYGAHQFHVLHLYHYPGRMQIDGREFAFSAGDVSLTPIGSWSSYDLPAGGYHLCVHFAPPVEEATTVALPADAGASVELPLLLPLGPMADFARQKLTSIVQYMAQRRHAASAAAASAALQELLLWLALRWRQEEQVLPYRRSDAAVEMAALAVEQNLGRPLTIPRLARQVGLSQNYLARRFRQRFGLTIPRYLLLRRIELARYLLTTTNLPIAHVGQRVGLPDAQHFNKQFRQLTGLSPTACRAGGQQSRKDWSPRFRALSVQLDQEQGGASETP